MPQVWPNGYWEAHTGRDLHSIILMYCTCGQLHSTTINTHLNFGSYRQSGFRVIRVLYFLPAHPRPGWMCRKSHRNNKIKVHYHSFSARRQHRMPNKNPPDEVSLILVLFLFLTDKTAAWASFMLSRHALCKYFWQIIWSSGIFESPTWSGSRKEEIRSFEERKSGFWWIFVQ